MSFTIIRKDIVPYIKTFKFSVTDYLHVGHLSAIFCSVEMW